MLEEFTKPLCNGSWRIANPAPGPRGRARHAHPLQRIRPRPDEFPKPTSAPAARPRPGRAQPGGRYSVETEGSACSAAATLMRKCERGSAASAFTRSASSGCPLASSSAA